MDISSIMKIYCNKCGCKTSQSKEWSFHKTDYFNKELGLEDSSDYCVYKCNNCGEFCFINFNTFYDGIELIDKTTDRYPRSLEKIDKVKDLKALPESIFKVYNETFIAIANECYILAMIGIRSIIEAVAAEENLKKNKKNNLNELIKDMVESGLIGKKEEEVLQKIRKIGNDAAHEMFKIDEDTSLKIFSIINNILEKIYCFDI